MPMSEARMTPNAFLETLRHDLEWLLRQPPSVERSHIASVLQVLIKDGEAVKGR